MKKKAALVLTTIMVCFSSMTVMAAPSAGTNGVLGNLTPYKVTGTNVNLRTNKGTWNTSLGWLDRGDLFNQAYDAGWASGYQWNHAKMITGRNRGKAGFVASKFTTFGK